MLALHEKYVIDEKGKKTATIVSYTEWKKVLTILEEYEDIRAYDRVKARRSHPVSFKKAAKKFKAIRP